MGLVGISWQELLSWQQSTGIALQPWEQDAIKKASDAYASMAQKAIKADCLSPTAKPIAQDPLKLAKYIKSVLRG